jgi:hypothetical protein
VSGEADPARPDTASAAGFAQIPADRLGGNASRLPCRESWRTA